ncbi:hypothetical protein [Sphingomonas sp. PB1R3]|uniref:hypothetical protein n=1 Tax=Sphingomonas flavida TaxID=3096154 RepID=UPI002FC7CE48
MQPSLILCRAREEHHLAISRAATLDNIRVVANAAAAAWAKEGVAAGMREDRKLRTRQFAEGQPQGDEPTSAEWGDLAENPDRARADAG